MFTIEFEHPVHKVELGRFTVPVNLNIIDEVFTHFDPFIGSIDQKTDFRVNLIQLIECSDNACERDFTATSTCSTGLVCITFDIAIIKMSLFNIT